MSAILLSLFRVLVFNTALSVQWSIAKTLDKIAINRRKPDMNSEHRNGKLHDSGVRYKRHVFFHSS